MVALALVCATPMALAQAVPGVGQTLQQLPPAAPAAGPRAPRLQLEQPGGPAVPADTTPIPVRRIELAGVTVFPESALRVLVDSAEGTTQSLAQLQALARRITEYYRSNGQPLARAYLPAQTIRAGVVRIHIVEAVYGDVRVKNDSAIRNDLLTEHVASLRAGEPVAQVPLERSLLLLQELAGVNVQAEARAGATAGSTDLEVDVQPGAMRAFSAGLDTMGSEATGRVRANASMQLYNLLGRGDTLGATVLSSGRGLAYGRLYLNAPLNGSGLWGGAALGVLSYQLGGAFAALNADGTARVAEVFVQQALVRNARTSVNIEARLEDKQLRDHVGTSNTHNNRQLTALSVNLNAESADTLGSSGFNTVLLGYTGGRVRFDDIQARLQDQGAGGARTEGGYGRWNMTLTRLQRFATPNTSLWLSARVQGASKNLDAAEQISISGPYGVRGYDANALAGAQGHVLSAELRHTLTQGPGGTWQGALLLDTGRAQVFKTAVGAGANSASMHSVGLGLNWTQGNTRSVQLSVARPFGSAPAIPAERRTRAWLQLTARF